MSKSTKIIADLDAVMALFPTRAQKKAIGDAAEELLMPLFRDPGLFASGAATSVTAAPAVAAGKPIAALGAGATTAGTSITPNEAFEVVATGMGLVKTDVVGLFGIIQAAAPADRAAVLNTAIQGAKGFLVDKADLDTANAKIGRYEQLLIDIENELGMSADALTNPGWKAKLATAGAAKFGGSPLPPPAPAPTGLDDASKAKVKVLTDKLESIFAGKAKRVIVKLGFTEAMVAEAKTAAGV